MILTVGDFTETIDAGERDEATLCALIGRPNVTEVRRRCALVILLYAGHPDAAARLAAADDDAETIAERGTV